VMAVTGPNQPDFRTIGDFRKRHLASLSSRFVPVLRLCQAAGLVKLGHVAVDGTKLRANASRHKAMSYKHMAQQEPKLAAEVASWLDQAEAADAAEDAQHGADRRGDETPDWMADTLGRAGRRTRYRLRKQVVEPVLGHIKQARGLRQFLLRGLTRSEASGQCSASLTTSLSCTEQEREAAASTHVLQTNRPA